MRAIIIRLLTAGAAAVGVLLWLAASPAFVAVDGSRGLTLGGAPGGPLWPLVVAAAVSLVMVAPGGVLAAGGATLRGLLPWALSLAIFAWWGGGLFDWMVLRGTPPGSYFALIGEVVVWQALAIGMAVGLHGASRWLARRRPGIARWVGEEHRLADWRSQPGPAGLAVAVTVVAAGLLVTLLCRSRDPGQVVVSLVIAFMVAGILARQLFPRVDMKPLLITPAIVAIIGYLAVPIRFDGAQSVLAALFNLGGATGGPRLHALALPLPVHYVGAGVTGLCLGLLWSRSGPEDRTDPAADHDRAPEPEPEPATASATPPASKTLQGDGVDADGRNDGSPAGRSSGA